MLPQLVCSPSPKGAAQRCSARYTSAKHGRPPRRLVFSLERSRCCSSTALVRPPRSAGVRAFNFLVLACSTFNFANNSSIATSIVLLGCRHAPSRLYIWLLEGWHPEGLEGWDRTTTGQRRGPQQRRTKP